MDIPHEPLDISGSSNGILPHLGLHRRGSIYRQESSYSHFIFCAVMITLAVFTYLQSWGSTTPWIGKISMQNILIFAFIWGGICGMAPYFIRNKLGQTIVIDPDNHSLQLIIPEPNIKHGKLLPLIRSTEETAIPWSRIMTLQICLQPGPNHRGYQLNLVWQDSSEAIRRHCLAKHTSKGIILSLGRRYERLFGFKVIDQSQA